MNTCFKLRVMNIVLCILAFAAVFFMIPSEPGQPEPIEKTIENVEPIKTVKIQDQEIILKDIEGFTIDVYSVANKTFNENLYVLRTYGRSYEIPFHSREDAENAWLYICRMKGDRL